MKLVSTLLFLILLGCGSSDDNAAEAEDTATEADDRETVFDPLLQSLDKAKEVEGIVLQQKLEMDAALKRMEGDEDDPEE